MQNLKEPETNIPAWMLQEEHYEPPCDQDGFLAESTLSIIGILSNFRLEGAQVSIGASPQLKTFYTLFFILLLACSRNMIFTWCMLAMVLIRICLLPARQLKSVCKASFSAAAFSALLLLPAVFLGSPHTMLTVSSKVFVSVSLMYFLAHTTCFNDLTGSLRFYHVPDLFIFTFDITLKYIVLLGDLCLDMLKALKLRSIGKNRKKGRSMSGVLGIAFLKSREMSEEMYHAMCCRGFDGEYKTQKKISWKKTDILHLLFMLLITLLFFYLEGAMK